MKNGPQNIILAATLITGILFAPYSLRPGEAAGMQPAASKAPEASILRIAPTGAAAACGSTWADPCNLEYALINAAAGDELWVMQGVYKPTLNGVLRDFSFLIKSGLKVYGGFAGGEQDRSGRDPGTHLTVLSGDIDDDDQVDANGVTPTSDDIAGGNAYHVVRFGLADATTVLDGFIITGGQADMSDLDSRGGGMLLLTSHPVLGNLTIVGNLASGLGGGMHNDYSNPTMNSVRLEANKASVGGGMHNAYSNPVLTNSYLIENQAGYGGGMANSSSSPQLSEVTISQNIAVFSGGGMDNTKSSPTLSDVDFLSNQALNGGGMRNTDASNPALDDVTFSENHADSDGGGMRNTQGSNPTLERVTFRSNQAVSEGGGMDNLHSGPVLDEVTFIDNHASNGGGMANTSSQPVLRSSTFTRNFAISNGGGMLNSRSSPVLAAVVFEGNKANQGGGLYNADSHPALMDVIFAGNEALAYGGGMINQESAVRLSQVTFAANHAGISSGAISNDSTNKMVLFNAILWGNTTGGTFSQIFNSGSMLISHAIIQGGCPNLSTCGSVDLLDPGFMRSPDAGADTDWGTPDDDYGDLRLIPSSAGIDAGGNNLIPADLADLDANQDFNEQLPLDLAMKFRTSGIAVDLGAYEGFERLFLPLVLQ